VYWRRRLLVLTLLLSVLGGGGWLGWAALTGRLPVHSAASVAPAATPVAAPSLAGVLPSLAGVRVPLVPMSDGSTGTASPAPVDPTQAPLSVAAGATPCSDDMIGLTLGAPTSATAGSSPSFTLTVVETAAVPCARSLDAGEQEVVLLDVAGTRLWSSADCATAVPPATPKVLAAGERVDLPITWDGRTSAPGCTGARTVVPAGSYVLRARLGTRTAAQVPLTLG
jgi:hypothetical protein